MTSNPQGVPPGVLIFVRPISGTHIIDKCAKNKGGISPKLQSSYALTLWAVQEKFGFTYEEAVFFASGRFRITGLEDPREVWFGLAPNQIAQWSEYLDSICPRKEYEQYVKPIYYNCVDNNFDGLLF